MVLTPVHRPKSDIAQCRSVRSQMVDEMRQTAYAFSYVTFGSLLSQIRLCVVCLSVCLSFVCNVGASYPGVEAFGNISSPLCTLAILDLRAKFYGDRPRGTPPSGALDARGVSK